MHFEWNEAASLDGELFYRQGEYSIDFKPASPGLVAERVGAAGNTSLSFTTLQIETGIEHGELLYPWGLFPNTRWQAGRLTVPGFRPGRVRLQGGEKLQPGVSVSFPESASWPIVWDKASGWICFGNATPHREAMAVEYAQHAAVVLVGGQLVSLWLQPKMTS